MQHRSPRKPRPSRAQNRQPLQHITGADIERVARGVHTSFSNLLRVCGELVQLINAALPLCDAPGCRCYATRELAGRTRAELRHVCDADACVEAISASSREDVRPLLIELDHAATLRAVDLKAVQSADARRAEGATVSP